MRDGKLPKDCYSCVMPSVPANRCVYLGSYVQQTTSNDFVEMNSDKLTVISFLRNEMKGNSNYIGV